MSDLAAIAVTVSPADKFREYLVTRGMRLTRERELVVAEVFSHHEHFDSDQLVERLAGQKLAGQKEGKRVSRATVYRTLQWMVDAGVARKVDFGEGRFRFEHSYRHPRHFHLICQTSKSVGIL